MSKSPQEELEEFLRRLPLWQQKALRNGMSSSLSPDEILLCVNWAASEQKRLTRDYEGIIAKLPDEWRAYRERRQKQRDGFWDTVEGPIPKSKPGPKEKTELAERIWQLDSEGKSNREIQRILQSEGISLSLEAVESYLKTRRRNSDPASPQHS